MEIEPEALVRSIPLGTRGEARAIVREVDLAPGRGVFSTPGLVALIERAASGAVAGYLPEGWSSVGTEICIRHLAPALPGTPVRATVVLASAEGRRIRFTVEAYGEHRKIGEGSHERAIVYLPRFQARAAEG